ncbi:MAG: excinuclease ABC subunit UvrC [Deltaproteobacteria bacterium]|nr:excinuclease ABC subunit UvrC [Deltaproteobacteria bacterium]
MMLLEKVKKAPTKPGVYLMKSRDQKIIYIGKARILRNRLSSYFQSKDHTARIQTMVNRIQDVEWIVTHSELEALLLECTLIKKHKPRYNVHFRDDKSYPYLRISVQEKWPQISIVRCPKRDEALYFGPYPSAYVIRDTLRLLTKIFPVRDCSETKFKNRSRPCLSYDIGICSAPCVGYVSEKAYQSIVQDLILFLRGKNKTFMRGLKETMHTLSKELNYEQAAKIRDRLSAIHVFLEKQKVVTRSSQHQDVLGLYRQDHHWELVLLFIRSGNLLGKKAFSFSGVVSSENDFLESFIAQYYEDEFLPDEIIVSQVPSNLKLLERSLKERQGKRVKLIAAPTGEKKAWVEMAIENAKEAVRGKNIELRGPQVLEALRKKLNLKNDPHRIECFDISNIQGDQAVGSRVTFMEGEPDKNLYRRYQIKTVSGPNDFAMMYEVLSRRFRGKDKDTAPDLLMVDGGKGQLAMALRVLKELEIENLDVCALAKEKAIHAFQGELQEKKEERIYLPGQKNPIVLKEKTPETLLLQRIRDEAHRFAITYHRTLRSKAFLAKESNQ